MRSIELGLVLPLEEAWTDGSTPRWVEIRELALRAEAMGFDTVWIPDELLWRQGDGSTHGWWESVAMTGAVAAATSRVKVGTWILSALHRNPAITARAVETLDEISGGRFVFGLGSGHAGKQAHAFGLPEDHVIGRFEEALEVIVPLLRAGRANFEGTYHASGDEHHELAIWWHGAGDLNRPTRGSLAPAARLRMLSNNHLERRRRVDTNRWHHKATLDARAQHAHSSSGHCERRLAGREDPHVTDGNHIVRQSTAHQRTCIDGANARLHDIQKICSERLCGGCQ